MTDDHIPTVFVGRLYDDPWRSDIRPPWSRFSREPGQLERTAMTERDEPHDD